MVILFTLFTSIRDAPLLGPQTLDRAIDRLQPPTRDTPRLAGPRHIRAGRDEPLTLLVDGLFELLQEPRVSPNRVRAHASGRLTRAEIGKVLLAVALQLVKARALGGLGVDRRGQRSRRLVDLAGALLGRGYETPGTAHPSVPAASGSNSRSRLDTLASNGIRSPMSCCR